MKNNLFLSLLRVCSSESLQLTASELALAAESSFTQVMPFLKLPTYSHRVMQEISTPRLT